MRCRKIVLQTVFVIFIGLVFGGGFDRPKAAETSAVVENWMPPSTTGAHLHMRPLDENGASLGEDCMVGDYRYGCTAYCIDSGKDCFSPARPYPYSTYFPDISYDQDYLLDVVAQETSPGLFGRTALEAQAIAARSYAWHQILNRSDHVINNSVSYQVFVPLKFDQFGSVPDNANNSCLSTNLSALQRNLCDAVVGNSAGYYLSWDDSSNINLGPAFTEFSADAVLNTSSGITDYLRSVADPISNLNETCPASSSSHGRGMSQNGAERWAIGNQCGATSNANLLWNVRWNRPEQILFHYYTDVNIRNANKQVVTSISPANRWNPLRFNGVLSQDIPHLYRGNPEIITVLIQNTGLSNWSCENGTIQYWLRYRWAHPAQGSAVGDQALISCGVAQGQSVSVNITMDHIPDWGYGDYYLRFDVIKVTNGVESPFSPAWPVYDKYVFVLPTPAKGVYTWPLQGAEVDYGVELAAQAGGDGNSAGVSSVEFVANKGTGFWERITLDETDCAAGQTCTYNAPMSLYGIGNGTLITLGINIRDMTGNYFLSPQGTRQITIHDDPPVITFDSANGNTETQIWSNQQLWTFVGTASDRENHMGPLQFQCDGDYCGILVSQTGVNSWSRTQNNLAGQMDIYFAAYDPALNRAESRHLDLRIDLATPSTTVRLNNAFPASWYSGTVSIGLNAVDNGTGRATSGVSNLTYSMDAQPSQTVYTDQVSLLASGEGPHSIQAYAMDQVGNQESPKTFNFNIDDTRPMVQAMSVITNGQGRGDCPFITGTVWLSVQATDSRSGVQAIRLSNDGTNWSEWQPYLSRILWTLPSTSTVNPVYVQARDRVDWVSETYSQSLQWAPSDIWCRYLPAVFRQR